MQQALVLLPLYRGEYPRWLTTRQEWMHRSQTSNDEWANRHRQSLTTRHSHEDVLNDREFELLLEAFGDLPAPRGFEARFICLLGGRLGLRAGETAHSRTARVDWNRKLIWIPQHDPCEWGYCQRQARQEAAHNDGLTETLPLRPVGTPRLSPPSGQSPSTCSCELNSVSDGLPTATTASHGRDPPSIGASRKPPTRRTYPGESAPIVWGRLPPATTPTGEPPPSRCKR